MMNRKGQLELSANFIVVIILSIIVFVGGLALFYTMIHNAQTTVKTLDGQTEAKIKDMMLDNARTAVYPGDITISGGDSELIGIGITNFYDEKIDFTVKLINVKRYADSNSEGGVVADIQLSPGNLLDYYSVMSNTITLNAHDKGAMGMLLKMPKGSLEGQYVYTMSITNDTNPYGIVQVTVNNK